ncbi:helix-turn-helix domain-containing protein [Labrys wisconsinensis]|nr:helix-turn-helix domain-containing protein [Labrys wisconsinensis]
MDIRPIRSDEDLTAALHEVETLWSAEPGTPEADKLEVLTTLIEAYEARHHPIPEADPIGMIRFFMEELGHTQTELAELLGSRSRASEVLNRRRPLTLHQIYRLNREWGIPADALVTPYPVSEIARKRA